MLTGQVGMALYSDLSFWGQMQPRDSPRLTLLTSPGVPEGRSGSQRVTALLTVDSEPVTGLLLLLESWG